MEILLTNIANPATLDVLLVQMRFPEDAHLAIQPTTDRSSQMSVHVKLDFTPILLEAQYV
jgi:hypothetical protein